MLQAPFPWFGAKNKAASQIWEALGADLKVYVEPFGGSLAVLLGRPSSPPNANETVNDTDGLLVNFWRSIKYSPEKVAAAADWPIVEIDLFARHVWLVNNKAEIVDRLHADPEWHDPVAAGWWVWGSCCWIGSGWCSGTGPWNIVDGKPAKVEEAERQQGVYRKLPELNSSRGVARQLPILTANQGVNRNTKDPESLVEWFRDLSIRLRHVRITFGDWERVLGRSALEVHGTSSGVLLDPPYPEGWDVKSAYAGQTEDARALCERVFTAAVELHERGNRVVLCGYEGTWEPPPKWTSRKWKPKRGYATSDENRGREVLWCSPNCHNPSQGGLF